MLEKVFLGTYPHQLDQKSRAIMPSKFREGLGKAFVITMSLDKCLLVYTLEEWAAVSEKVRRLPTADKQGRAFLRYFFGGAATIEPDQQGRFLIPQALREYAGITRELVSVGVSHRIEVWAKEEWEGLGAQFPDDEIQAKMAELGI